MFERNAKEMFTAWKDTLVKQGIIPPFARKLPDWVNAANARFMAEHVYKDSR